MANRILEMNWIRYTRLDWCGIFKLTWVLLGVTKSVFASDFGSFKGDEAHIELKKQGLAYFLKEMQVLNARKNMQKT